MCLNETENMVYELVLTTFTQKWLNFENLSLCYELVEFSSFTITQAILKDVNYKIHP